MVDMIRERERTQEAVKVMGKRGLGAAIRRIIGRQRALRVLVGLAAGVTLIGLYQETRSYFSPQSGVLPFTSDAYVPGEFLVKPKPGVPPEIIRALNRKLGVAELEYLAESGVFRLGVPRGFSVMEMIKLYANYTEVEYAKPNYLTETDSTFKPQAQSP